MSFNVMMWFAIGLCVYLLCLGIYVLIKRIRNKIKVTKEDNEHNEVIQNEEDNK